MPRWLPGVLERIREFASRGAVRFTQKASNELAFLGLGLDVDDCCDILLNLSPDELSKRIWSHRTAEWMYVFKPRVAETLLYLKLILRDECVVVSFHEEDENEEDSEADEG